MKILICTTPIRPVPTEYPPFGSLALLQALKQNGYDPYFYDIDALRPSFEEVIQFIREYNPDLIGISAVVSTAYEYTKRLSLHIKKWLPNVPIVVGGNLAASAEILHRFCKVDLCVAGEGERTIVNIANYFKTNPKLMNYDELEKIKGLTFLNQKQNFVFTGFEIPLQVNEFLDPDFSILEKFSKISNFLRDPTERADFARDSRTYQPHRKGQKMSTILSTKGCVARCTFCHRWDKGYRHFEPEVIVRRIKYLRDNYNVGFFSFGDENFGSDRKKAEALLHLIKPLDILFHVSGVRVRSVDPGFLNQLKEAGCVGLYYGMESGSPSILKVMEKNAILEDNLRAALWTHEAGLYTIYQLVLGMPGENSKTIDETIEFAKTITGRREELPHKLLSINYIQALPGTPVYEHARSKGFIGSTLEDEEKYLLKISDIDASDDSKFINFTEEDYLTVQYWRLKILFETGANWFQKKYLRISQSTDKPEAVYRTRDYEEGGYFNQKKLTSSPLFYKYFFFMRYPYYVAYVVAKNFMRQPFRIFINHIYQFINKKIEKRGKSFDYQSLRLKMKEIPLPTNDENAKNMLPLRLGR